MRTPSVVACVGEEVLVYRFYCGLWRLACGSVIKVNNAFENGKILAYRVNVVHQAYIVNELNIFCSNYIVRFLQFNAAVFWIFRPYLNPRLLLPYKVIPVPRLIKDLNLNLPDTM